MLRLWLPQRHLLFHRLHPSESSFWCSRGVHHFYTSSFCLDRRCRITAGCYESSISTLEKKSKGQRKREAHRAVDWAAQFANFSDSQIRRAIRWGNLQEEVYDAVRTVKKIGRDGRYARTRQLKLIGGMLREVDPELMEAIIKAIKDGDVEGVFIKSGDSKGENEEDDTGGDDENEDEDDDVYMGEYEDDDVHDDDVNMGEYEDDDEQGSSSSEHELDSMETDDNLVERWLQGLLSGDSDVVAEVYSIRSADFNRQELRRLVRDTLKSDNRSAANGAQAVSEQPASATKKVVDPRAKLREYLECLMVKSCKS